MSEEHYRALGISPDASKAEIRAAYKQRVKETHPDLNDDPDAAAEFQRVKAARDALLGSGATGRASSGGGRSGQGSSGSGGTSGTDGTGTSSSGRSAGRNSSSGGRTETSGSGADSRERRSDAGSDGSDPRANYSTRTEEPSGDHADQYGGATGSNDRTSGGSSTGSGSAERSRTDRSETAAGSGSRRRGAGGAGGDRTSGGSTDRRQESGAGGGGAQDYVRFRSVIEEPTGNRAASYDRVVTSTHTPARQGATGAGTGTGTGGVSSVPMLLPAFLVVLVKQYIYSLKWGLLGLPLTGLYLYGIRGLYFGGQPTTTALSFVLGALGVSLVKVRLGVNVAGTATVPLVYFALVWHSNPGLLEVGIAFHLVPVFVVLALISEYS